MSAKNPTHVLIAFKWAAMDIRISSHNFHSRLSKSASELRIRIDLIVSCGQVILDEHHSTLVNMPKVNQL